MNNEVKEQLYIITDLDDDNDDRSPVKTYTEKEVVEFAVELDCRIEENTDFDIILQILGDRNYSVEELELT